MTAAIPYAFARRQFVSDYFVLYLGAAYLLLAWPFAPDIASAANFGNLFLTMLPLLLVAVGQTFVLISGGIDLSVTSIMALASISGALLMRAGTPPFAAIIAMVGIGVAVGFFNGCAVRLLGMPPFMVTLTTMMFFGGFAIWLTKSANVAGLPVSFLQIEQGTVWIFPVPLLLAGILALAAHVLLSRTLYGQWLYATGMNASTAAAAGLPVHRVVIAAYVLCGVCAAIAGVLLTARLETGSPVLGQRILLDVIGAAVIGGTSLFGGRGSIRGTLFGVLFIALLDNSLNLIGFSYFLVLIAKGAVILAAALLDALRTRTLAGA